MGLFVVRRFAGPPEGWISVLLSGKPLAVVARGEAGAPAPSKDEASATTEPVPTATLGFFSFGDHGRGLLRFIHSVN